MSKGTILLVEDNPEVLAGNAYMLGQAGYRVCSAGNLAEARACVAAGMPDLLVLDILLPDGSGLSFCREVRRRAEVPILFLTALGDGDSTVRGLKAGGDDYLAKPYEYKVLLARVEALLRRAGPKAAPALRFGPLELDFASRRALLDGADLLLSPKEFLLLELLARRQGEFVAAGTLFERVWGLDSLEDVRTVKEHVYRLRKKLEHTPVRIESERGKGYRFTTGAGGEGGEKLT